MAVVKLGRPVKSNLGGPNGAMAYIINPAKTEQEAAVDAAAAGTDAGVGRHGREQHRGCR